VDLYREATLRPRVRGERRVVGDGDGADDGQSVPWWSSTRVRSSRWKGSKRRWTTVRVSATAATRATSRTERASARDSSIRLSIDAASWHIGGRVLHELGRDVPEHVRGVSVCELREQLVQRLTNVLSMLQEAIGVHVLLPKLGFRAIVFEEQVIPEGSRVLLLCLPDALGGLPLEPLQLAVAHLHPCTHFEPGHRNPLSHGTFVLRQSITPFWPPRFLRLMARARVFPWWPRARAARGRGGPRTAAGARPRPGGSCPHAAARAA